MGIKIKDIYVEYQRAPLGIDERIPRFSWLLESDEKQVIQTACRIRVEEDGREIWDSGKLETGESQGIPYEGKELQPCTRYDVTVDVWDNHGNDACADTIFETGFFDTTEKAWEGAKWIGAPRYTVCAQNRGVFILETEFALEGGRGRAGVVFGANDFRLLEHSKNEFGLEGENYIRFEINLTGQTPSLDIYRVGYARGDQEQVPFASAALVNFSGEEKTPLIHPQNAAEFHKLRIEVDGNNSFTYVDDILVDAEEKTMFFGKMVVGRTLNPRGHNDVLTYPRLNEIGFFAAQGTKALFRYIKVRNMRHPSRAFIFETPDGNINGGESIFAGRLPVKDGCFLVEDRQITEDPSNTSVPMFRTILEAAPDKKIKKARLYITSRGVYECRVNGKKITDRVLPPGLTQYDKRMNYQTYDITDCLKSGKNGLGVTVASGWWSDAQTFTVRNYNYFGDKEALLAKAVIDYEDGTRTVCVSDTENWKYFGEGPYLYSVFFAGEQYDAGRAWIYEKYSDADFDDGQWEKPVVVKTETIPEFRALPPGFGRAWPQVHEGTPELTGEYDAPVYVVDQRTAVSRREQEPGVYIYDMEQVMAGVPRITFHEKKGTKVIIRYAEVLYPDLPEYAENAGKMMLENYRDATSTDVYICGGAAEEIWQPRFTFHGYRYIEISGVQNPPAPEEVLGLQYSSITEFDGSFKCDNELLNRFVQNVAWSQKANFINIPTDCPQRNERMGWAGDTHVFCRTAVNNSNLKLFYERNLQAMADLQTPEGQYPEIAPVGGGFGGITYECASIFIAWELYQQYGDLRTLTRFYPGMKKYMEYMKTKGLPGMGNISEIGPLGDWLAPQETDLQLLWNAFYYKEAYLMSRIAELVEDEEGKQEYAALAEQVKKFWNETFLDPRTKKTCAADGTVCDTQCSYVLGLEYGVAEDKTPAQEHLIRKTRELDFTVGTGFFGTGLLNRALTEAGSVEDAYKLMLQTRQPSWLYPVTQGATTIWERWDSYTKENGFGGHNSMNSFNHYSLGSVLSWIYQTVLGICRDENCPGYRHFILKPEIGPLDHAEGSVASPYGKISAGWRRENKEIIYHCSIPVNTSAALCLPDGSRQELGSGQYVFRVKMP